MKCATPVCYMKRCRKGKGLKGLDRYWSDCPLRQEVKSEMKTETRVIKFDRIWKKLVNPIAGHIFATIRRSTLDKFAYYRNSIGKEFEIEITNTRTGFKRFDSALVYLILLFEWTELNKAKLIDITRRRFLDIPKELIEYDTRE